MTYSSYTPSRLNWFKKQIECFKEKAFWILANYHLFSKQPDQIKTAHTQSFFLHFRPRSFPASVTRFSYTFRLGFFAVFLFVIELITGLFLMLYYSPTPETAYLSILRIIGEVPFGNFMRDLHRLSGEMMLVIVIFHLLRTFLTDSFRGRRAFTWVTGVMLLILTLGLVFSGYLLPWDQHAYWAVTIGTSMAEAVPFIGHSLNLLLRGAPGIGADGLLRFYLLHVFLLPMLVLLIIAVHYYRVARKHGISLPLKCLADPPSQTSSKAVQKSVPYLPEMISQELILGITALLILVIAALFFYDSPLSQHADPNRTPLNTQAPWFFLWLQGLLKLGNKTIMGVFIPFLFITGLFALPYFDRSHRRLLRQRPKAIAGMIITLGVLLTLSFVGTHHFSLNLPPTTRLLQEFCPEDGTGQIHKIPFESLPIGIYTMIGEQTDTPSSKLSPKFAAMLKHFHKKVDALSQSGILAADAIILVEDWQVNLKRITFRISWQSQDSRTRKTAERIIHRHRDRRF